MEISIEFASHNSWGGHRLCFTGDFLLLDAPDFGPAVREIEFFIYLRDRRPLKGMERMFADYHRYRSTLPKVTYRRTKARVEIRIATDLLDRQTWWKDRVAPPSLHLFTAFVDEVVQALSLLRRSLKPADAFDLNGFLAHCAHAKQRIP